MGSSLSRHQGSSIANQANNGEIESGSSSHISIADETEVDAHRSRFAEFCGLSLHGSSRRSRTRLYQVWPAKNVFFAGGRLVCGPDPRGFLLTSVSLVLSIWAFCTNIGGPSNHSAVVLAIALGLSVIVFVNLILVGTTDPGIIPRNDEPPPEVAMCSGPRFSRLVIDGVEVKLKYCRICKIFRPPRSCHCIVCDNCVEKFDHHCLWIGQCIGLRNYRYYMMFIVSGFAFFVHVCVFSWWRIGRRISETRSGVLRVVADEPETFAVAVFSFFAIWFLGGLSAFHVILIFKNQTARESFKRQFAKSPNPYDKGIMGNIKDALFTKLPPSKVSFRSEITPYHSVIATPFNIEGVDEEELQQQKISDDEISEGVDEEELQQQKISDDEISEE